MPTEEFVCSFTELYLPLQVGPKKHNTWERDNIKRAIISVRNKRMHLLRASVLCELPKSTPEDKFNIKEQNIRKIILIRSCKNTVLSEVDFRTFFWKSLL